MKLLEMLDKLPVNPDLPEDFAEQHDHYLYGTPKRQWYLSTPASWSRWWTLETGWILARGHGLGLYL